MRWLGAFAAPLLIALACAQPSPPPGGPPDLEPPRLLSVSPESGAVGVRPTEVVFRFDEVVSERPQGAADLKGLFLISPRDGDANVKWRRDVITVRPTRGWRANTVYTITMLPGLLDLRGNADRAGASVAFATGSTFPATLIAGVVFDWSAQRPAPKALIEAVDLSDSTTYVAVADSAGRFRLSAMRPGPYAVRGIIDANNNRRREAREAWDSIRVDLRDSARVELLAIAHDTIGPRVGQVAIRDSVTLRVPFDQALSPLDTISISQVRITRSDSTPVIIALVLSVAEFDRREQDLARARADSARTADTTRRADTARRVVPVPVVDSATADSAPLPTLKPSRAPPITEMVVRLAASLRPSTAYRLRVENVKGIISAPRTSERVFTTPKPPAPKDTSAVRGRSAGARDSSRTRRDTTRRLPADTARRP